MTEYTVTDAPPAPPPPGKTTNWKVIIPVAIVVVLCCLCLVVAGVLAYMGTRGTGPLAMLATPTSTPTRTPTKTPTPTLELTLEGDWDIYYDWDCTGTYSGPAFITFFSDITFSISESGSDPAYGVWSLSGDYVDFLFNDDPYSHYVGTVDSSLTYMEGTMDNTAGGNGCWYGIR